ncbi:NYN domain-containing protein [Massilia aurea]|uniref:NYN domain-containing protein n=1 Tax=Massilia aurea TaxID=373040 RepID=UPI0034637D65
MPMEPNVAVLVDCENAQSAVLDRAMQHATTLGRVALRRAYGNAASLTNKWQDGLIRHGFAPCLQFQYVGGKNTADIALALDALEMLLDRRADQFVIVTSDSDFVGLCRKLQERGAGVHVFGEAKTPAALRHACDRFHEAAPQTIDAPRAMPVAVEDKATNPVKRRPRFVVEAVRVLASSAADGRVDLGALGNHLRQTHAGFTHAANGYKNLRSMLEAYDLLCIHQDDRGHCRVGLASAVPPAAPILRAV